MKDLIKAGDDLRYLAIAATTLLLGLGHDTKHLKLEATIRAWDEAKASSENSSSSTLPPEPTSRWSTKGGS